MAVYVYTCLCSALTKVHSQELSFPSHEFDQVEALYNEMNTNSASDHRHVNQKQSRLPLPRQSPRQQQLVSASTNGKRVGHSPALLASVSHSQGDDLTWLLVVPGRCSNRCDPG